MSLPGRRFFLRRRPCIDTAIATVITDAVHPVFIHYPALINVANDCDVHIVHRPVVKEPSVFPTSTLITFAEIAEPIRNPAVETNPRSPISFVENISFTAPAPPCRSPQVT